MARRTTAFLVCLTVCWTSTPSRASEISGTWQIDTRDGPAPICKLAQVGNTLNGTCIGPRAAGSVTGTVAGPTVRWHWRWISYASQTPGDFDFLGTLESENAMTGTVTRPETGFSLTFTANRKSIAPDELAATAPVQQPQDRGAMPTVGQDRQRPQWIAQQTQQRAAAQTNHLGLSDADVGLQSGQQLLSDGDVGLGPRHGSACEAGHWVEDVMSDGDIVKLEDGSLWEVAGGDEATSALWLPATEIVVCDGKLINTDDNESVEATRVR